MSFIDIASQTEGMQEEHAVPGREYKLRIVSANTWPAGSDPQAFMVRFEIVDDPYAKSPSDFINIPSTGRDAKEQNRYKLRLDAFAKAFGITGAETDENGMIEEWKGLEGWAILKDPVDKGDGYGPQNKITKYMGN